MIARLQRWWHRSQGHQITISHMTPLPGDTGSNRWYRCDCGRTWP